MAVYGELGRFPMYVLRYHKIIKYWFKVLQTENIILKNVYLQSLHDVKCGKRNWVFNVKRILDIYGFSDVFNNPASYNPVLILSLLKEKMVDCFKQEQFSHIRDSSSLILYKSIKSSLCFEEYFNILPISLRSHLFDLEPLRTLFGFRQADFLTTEHCEMKKCVYCAI